MEEKFITIDGNKIRYLESGGTDKTIVLLHGIGASAERWEFVIPEFSKHYKVIVPDLIGFGHSDKPLVDYTTEFFSDFLSSFLQKLGIARTNIIGSSLGGQITAKYADEFVSSIQDCRFYMMDNCGHTPYVDDPKRFAKLVLDFLEN